MRSWILLLTFVLLSSCKAREEADSGAGSGSGSASASASRPYSLDTPFPVPSSPVPLLVFLHGYGSSGSEQVRWFRLEALAHTNGFVLAYPDGTTDVHGMRFWNATDACCDFEHTGVDDVGYIRDLLDDVATRVPIDPQRVYVFGFSNGGFLAHRLACELSSRLSAVVSLAGATWGDASRCSPSESISVLEIHGDADQSVAPDGGLLFAHPDAPYPSVAQTLATWAAKDGCTGAIRPTGRHVDFVDVPNGAETTERTYAGCPTGVTVASWRIAGAGHLATPTPSGMKAVWDWMAAHPKKRMRERSSL
jgi:polyhydroxybutyrate depolymerase